jgi:hypothetical protein
MTDDEAAAARLHEFYAKRRVTDELSAKDEALAWAGRGFRILPLWWSEDGACACELPHPGDDARNIGKHPIGELVEHGVTDATTAAVLIGRWFTKFPEANYGIRIGENYVVLDFDSEASLDKFKAAVAASGERLPITLFLRTGRGIHIWFSVPEGTNVPGNVPGVIETIKHGNAYVVGPGSVHVSGRVYNYLTDPCTAIAPAPSWLLALFAEHAHTGPAPPLPDEVHQGEARPNFIFSYARTLFQARGGLGDVEVLEACRAVNRHRCKPPLSDAELEKHVKGAGKYERAPRTEVPPAPTEGGSEATIPAETWPKLDEAALHGLAGEIVNTIDPHTEADPVAVLVHVLVFFGNAVGRTPYAQVGADRHFTNLFAIIVGDTAKGRKGSAASEARRMFRLTEPTWESLRILGGLSTGEGLIYAVRDPVEKEEKLKAKGGTESFQTVIADKGVEDKRLLAMQSEFASTLKVAAREGNILSDVVKQAWDSGDLRVMTRNSPNKATGAHISIIGHSTTLDLQKYLSDTEAGNGFGNRFLWVCAKRSKSLPDGGALTETDLAPLQKQLEDALDAARRQGRVARDEEARKLWRASYDKLGEGSSGLYGALTSRATAQVLRLSLVYALLDAKRATPSIITKQHLQAALALWNYCDQSVRYIFGDATGDQTADKILLNLRQRRDDGMTRTEVNGLFNRNVKAPELDRAIALLERLGRITTRTADTRGRRETRFFAL